MLRKQSKIVNCAARPLFARADGDARRLPRRAIRRCLWGNSSAGTAIQWDLARSNIGVKGNWNGTGLLLRGSFNTGLDGIRVDLILHFEDFCFILCHFEEYPENQPSGSNPRNEYTE